MTPEETNQRVINLKQAIVDSKINRINASEASRVLGLTYLRAKDFLIDLELQGVLKRRQQSISDKYKYIWWGLPENIDQEIEKEQEKENENVNGGINEGFDRETC